MQPDDTVALKDVEFIKEASVALLCRIDGKDMWIARSQIVQADGLTVPGRRGTLVISGWLARQLHLA